MLVAGLGELGLPLSAQEGHRLWMLNAIGVPDGVDEAGVRRRLLAEQGIEIGAGLGPMKGKVWRVGLMGASATEEHVRLFLDAMKEALDAER
jgi:alanine-glyoxylate transaminase/serine-glyoxylate transaminase/serine-pyruvate transaminase